MFENKNNLNFNENYNNKINDLSKQFNVLENKVKNVCKKI